MAGLGKTGRVREFFAVPENAKAYQGWLRDPVTVRVFELAEECLRPVMKPVDMNANRYGGLVDGRFETLRVLTQLDVLDSLVQAAQEADQLPANYGAEEVLKTSWGVNKVGK